MVGDQEGLASVGHFVSPYLNHLVHGHFFARGCVHTTVFAIPVDGTGDVTGAQKVEGMALGRVTLSQVVRERPEVAGVAGSEGFESAARADRVELAIIAYGDQFRPGCFHSRQQLPNIGVRGHRALVQHQDMARGEHLMAVLDAPGERRHRTGGHAGAFAEGFGCLSRSRCPEDLVTGVLETLSHG